MIHLLIFFSVILVIATVQCVASLIPVTFIDRFIMKYYILQSGSARYAVAAISRADAFKRINDIMGPAQWRYVNMASSKQDVKRFNCNLVG